MEEKALGPSPLRLATSPPQGDHVLVDLFSSMADGGLCGQNSLTHLQKGILCSTKKEGTLTFHSSLMELESIMLSEISQVVKYKYHVVSPIRGT